MSFKQFRYLILQLLFISITPSILLAQQATNEKFGQNRVQNKVFPWQYYDTTHFRVVFYEHGKYNAQYVLQQAEADLPQIIFMMGARLPNKIDIIIYNSFSDYKQTNIGKFNQEMSESENGIVDVSRNSIAIYFDGTHSGLRNQIRKGIAKIIKDNILFGYTLKEIVQNNLKMNLPLWFTNGYVQYISEDWDADKNAHLFSLISKNQKHNFSDLVEANPNLLGQSFFNFISKQYNETSINNLLFLARNRQPINKMIPAIFKIKQAELFEQWKAFYMQPNDTLIVDSTAARKFIALLKPKPNAILKQFALSPDGAVIAYCEVLDGQYNIKLFNISNGKSQTIIEGGIRNSLETADPNYPLICWNTNGKKLAMMYEKDYYQRLKIYDGNKGRISDRIITTNKFDRLNGMAFLENDEQMILSCIKKGQSDLYQFTIKNAKLVQMTKDIWDDLAPTYIKGNTFQGIFFMSNRPTNAISSPIRNDQLPNTPFHLYYWADKGVLTNISKNIEGKVSHLIQYGTDRIAFLVEKEGKKERWIAINGKNSGGKDSIYFQPSNPIDYSISNHANLKMKNTIIDIVEKKGKYFIYNTPISYLDTFDAFIQSPFISSYQIKQEVKQIDKASPEIFFLSDFTNDVDSMDLSMPKKDKLQYDSSVWKPKKYKAKQYIPIFSPDYLQTTLDNSLLFNKYQKLDQGNGLFKYPELGAMLRLSLIDMHEDYKITAGVRVPVDLSPNIAYQVKFANYKKRLDWEISFTHNSDTMLKDNRQLPQSDKFYSPIIEYAKQGQNFLQSTFTYPLNITTSIRLETGLRQDQLRYKSNTSYSLLFPTQSEYWSFNRIEYIYDNSIQTLVNIRKGTRLKFYADGFLQLKSKGANMYAVGTDVRHYLPIYKNIIFASRLSAAVSGGKNRLLYRLGGIDNEIIPNQNRFIPILDTTVEYGYQTTVTNVRGYKQNSRNGSSYAVINEEIRIPVVNTITRRKVKSKFLQNLQFVGFLDVGSAWTGWLNEAEDFTYIAGQSISGNVLVTAQQKSSATMIGYGTGFRTSILGYYIHTDIGWNIDRRLPRLSIGLNHDF